MDMTTSSAYSIVSSAKAEEHRVPARKTRGGRPRRILGRAAALVAVAVLVTLPLNVADRFWLTIITTAGIYAVGAVGLNLLTGYLGEASLGHAFFMGLGAYVAIYMGEDHSTPMMVWMLAALLAGGVVGAIFMPLALRLRGGQLLIVTLGLVFLGQWVFTNWRDVTGGPSGRSVDLPLAVGPVDFGALTMGQAVFTAAQSFAVLVLLVCTLATLVVRNIARSRTGRAMRAIHDNEVAASAAGISLFRAKLGAFIVSSALAALAGAFLVQQLRYVEPAAFGLLLSIQFFVILIIGGSGSTAGPAIGAFFVAAAPLLLQRMEGLPFVLDPVEAGFGLTAGELSSFLFAALLVLFLLFEPGGINRIISRLCGFVARHTRGRAMRPKGSES